MIKLNPYIKFNDAVCREAMNFYKDCFGGELTFMTVGESSMAKDFPQDKQDLIVHSVLTVKNKNQKGAKNDIMFFGSDMMRDRAVIGDSVGIALGCDSEEELDDLFVKLSEYGDVFMEPDKTSWDGYFGMVTDKYGVEWMLNYRNEPMKDGQRRKRKIRKLISSS